MPSLFQLFQGFGVNLAVTRYSAYYISLGRIDEAKRFTVNGVMFQIILGITLTLANYLSASNLSTLFLGRPGIGYFVQLASVIILGQAFLQAAITGLLGWNRLGSASATYALQGLLKLVISVGFLLLGFGVSGAILGNVLSYVISGLVFLAVLSVKRLEGFSKGIRLFLVDLRVMVRYSFPIFAGTFFTGMATVYVSIILASIASNSVVGYYQAAFNVTAPIGLVTSSISASLFPAFARLEGVGGNIATALRLAVKYVSFLVTPVVVFLIPVSFALVDFLYGHSYSPSVIYLQLFSLSYLPLAIGMTVIPVVFNSVGKTRLSLVTSSVGAFSLLLLAPILALVMGLGVVGLILALSISNLTVAASGLVLAKKNLAAQVEHRVLLGIMTSCVAALLVTYPLNLIPLPAILSLFLQMIVFVVVYLTAAPLLHAVKSEDVDLLETSTVGLGFLGPLVRPIFAYERYLLSSLSRR